jgi:hypothetical protein
MMQLSQSDTPDGLKQAIEGCIQAPASVHGMFVEWRWTGAELCMPAEQRRLLLSACDLLSDHIQARQ